jgi:hypothetical protein
MSGSGLPSKNAGSTSGAVGSGLPSKNAGSTSGAAGGDPGSTCKPFSGSTPTTVLEGIPASAPVRLEKSSALTSVCSKGGLASTSVSYETILKEMQVD